MNNIVRHSSDSMMFSKGMMSGDKFYMNLMHAMQGKEPMTFKSHMWGFPEHMMLPKGSVDGMRYKLFFYIGPYENGKVFDLPFLGKRMWYGKSLDFPLDRPIQPWIFKLNNIYLKDVMIYNIIDNEMIGGYSQNIGYESIMKDYNMMKSMDSRSNMNMGMMRN